jgi:hypothetical protein
MALNLLPGSRTKLLQFTWLMIALIALNGINFSSSAATTGNKKNSGEIKILLLSRPWQNDVKQNPKLNSKQGTLNLDNVSDAL